MDRYSSTSEKNIIHCYSKNSLSLDISFDTICRWASARMAEPEQKAVVIALGGASSCGKTTLARLVRDIFPNSFILHEDDFYKPEDQ
jgi:chloramphenicol 3-O-phosphotransferase